MATKPVTFVIHRCNIDENGAALRRRRHEYSLEVNDRMTVLDALEVIRRDQDWSLMYRHSCHHGSCGTCGMIVNGERKLACLTQVTELEGATFELQPLRSMNPLGDLAVDPSPLFADFPQGAGYLRRSELNADRRKPFEVEHWERFEDCIECGLCVSSCPVTESFMGPAALAAYNREIINRPERRRELLAEVNVERGVWPCTRALNCSRVCPTGVYPARHIAELRKKLEQDGLTPAAQPGEKRARISQEDR